MPARRSARALWVLRARPANGCGIQLIPGREQPYVVWFDDEVVGFAADRDEAYKRLQEAMDG